MAQPLGNLYPNSSYTQGPIKDGNGNILYNTDSGSYTEESLKLHIDNQTIQVNANGELVANLDELGNEVNTLSGRVATVETNMGGVKIQKITQAEYDVLDPKDANTMYLIVG